MKKNVLVILLVIAIITPISFLFGFNNGKSKSEEKRFNLIISNLQNDITIFDFGLLGQSEKTSKLSAAAMEKGFYEMIEIYNEYGFSESEYLRCAATRRVRKFIELKKIYDGWDAVQMEPIKQYLAENCLGEPSHLSWATMEKNPSYIEPK